MHSSRAYTCASDVEVGAALADLVYAGLAFSLGSLALAALARYESVLKLVAGLALLGFGTWHAGRALRAKRATPAGAPPLYAPLRTAFALTIVNPLTIVLFAAFAVQLRGEVSMSAIGAAAFALFLGSLLVQLVWAASGFAVARAVANVGAIRVLNVASGLAIAAFGAAGIVRLVLAR